MRVFLNPRCGYGSGLARWRRIEGRLRERIGPFSVEQIRSPLEIGEQVQAAFAQGEREFVAAGGDGTVHLLVNALAALPEDPLLALGALGLGSSNDFHKPRRRDARIGGTPLRIDFDWATACDVVRARLVDALGDRQTCYFAINASAGITAEANALFNAGGGLLRLTRALSVEAAILAAAVATLLRQSNQPMHVSIDGGEDVRYVVSNLGIVKNPHFAGSLCYDTAVAKDDGQVAINIAHDMNRAEKAVALGRLLRRRFSGRPKTVCLKGQRVTLRAEGAFALEMDGEVVRVQQAQFDVLPRRLRLCP